MKIEFTIGWAWVEVFCHIMAGFFYVATGVDISSGTPSFGILSFIMAVGLTCIGVNL